MVVTELDSFVQKFHQLWNAGLNAHLNLDAHAGNAWVSLHLQLGHAPGPLHHHQPVPTFVPGGARIRRREKRAAARKNAEELNAKETKKAETVEIETDEIVINEETTEKATAHVQDAIIDDKEYNNKVMKVQECVKKICEVQIFPEHNADINELRNTVKEYFEKKTDVIEKVLGCEVENFGRHLRLVTLLKFRNDKTLSNGWTGYFSDKETNFGDLKGIRRMLHDCKDLYNCGDPNTDR